MDVTGSIIHIGRNKKMGGGVRISLYLSFNIKRNKAIQRFGGRRASLSSDRHSILANVSPLETANVITRTALHGARLVSPS